MLITYTNGDRPTSMPARRHLARHRLVGTAHRGPQLGQRRAHLAVGDSERGRARRLAPIGHPDQVGVAIIDTLRELDRPPCMCCKSCSASSCARRRGAASNMRGPFARPSSFTRRHADADN